MFLRTSKPIDRSQLTSKALRLASPKRLSRIFCPKDHSKFGEKSLRVAASEVAEKLLSFVGRAFRHDITSAFSSGVLTPDCPKPHFSATCSAATLARLYGLRFSP